mgnify:CR=1 FL=1
MAIAMELFYVKLLLLYSDNSVKCVHKSLIETTDRVGSLIEHKDTEICKSLTADWISILPTANSSLRWVNIWSFVYYSIVVIINYTGL